MTRAEIKRHAAAILKLRSTRSSAASAAATGRYADGRNTPNDYNPRRRTTYTANHRNASDGGCAPVDQMFAARQRAGWLPRSRDV